MCSEGNSNSLCSELPSSPTQLPPLSIFLLFQLTPTLPTKSPQLQLHTTDLILLHFIYCPHPSVLYFLHPWTFSSFLLSPSLSSGYLICLLNYSSNLSLITVFNLFLLKSWLLSQFLKHSRLQIKKKCWYWLIHPSDQGWNLKCRLEHTSYLKTSRLSFIR